MIKVTRFFYIHWSLLPLFLLAWWSGGLFTLLLAYAVVTIHELFHLFAALLVKERVGSLMLLPFGMTLRLSAGLIREPGKEIFIALSGPFANFLMLLVARALESLYGAENLALLAFRMLNWFTLSVNLLPCLPLDGGRVVKAMLVRRLGYLSAVSVMRRISRVVTLLLAGAGLVLLCITRLNVSLLMAAAFLAFRLTEEQRENEYILMREILYSKEKLRKKGAMRSRHISAIESVRARDIFKMLGYDSFYVVCIVDKDLKPLRMVTESQLVDAILEKGWQIRLSEVF
ncbi:MAG: hypothetical protein E7414_03095 [Ruminococcaceae bacterium]|nr:hypothetical protein [Oscillospiraceae bacterium]